MCDDISRCYNDVNICLWTDGSSRKRSVAQSLCTQRNAFLPRVTNSDIQNKLAEFRSDDGSEVDEPEEDNDDCWIDVQASAISDFHWIDGSSLAGQFIINSRVSYCVK